MRHVALALCAVILGLTVHLRGGALPPDVRDVLGDAIWAAMVAWGIAAVSPAIRLPWRAVEVLAVVILERAPERHRSDVTAAER